MSDDPKYSGVGPHGTMPSLSSGKSRDEMMAEFKAKMTTAQVDRLHWLFGPNPSPDEIREFKRQQRIEARHKKPAPAPAPKDTKSKDYPWMREGWKW